MNGTVKCAANSLEFVVLEVVKKAILRRIYECVFSISGRFWMAQSVL